MTCDCHTMRKNLYHAYRMHELKKTDLNEALTLGVIKTGEHTKMLSRAYGKKKLPK